MTRKRPGALTPAKLALIIFWIIVALVFLRTCYQHQSKTTGTVPSPLELAREHPKPRPPPPRKVKLEIRNYKVQSLDKYRFVVTFRVVNEGNMAANSIRFTLHPWVGGGYVPDRGDDINPKDPILKAGKDDYIGRLEPGQSAPRSLEFYEAYGYYPGLAYGDLETNMQKFEFFYADAP